MKDLLQKSKTELISELHNVRAQLAAAMKQAAQQAVTLPGIDEDALRKMLPEAEGDEVFLATETGRLAFANELMTGRLGYESHEASLLTIPDIDQEKSRGEWLSLVSSLKRSGKSANMDVQHTARDGGTVEKSLTLKFVNTNGKNYVLGIARLKRPVEDPREQAAGPVTRDAFMMNVMFDGFLLVDTKGAVRDINQAMELMLGYGRADILGRTYLDPRWRLLDDDMNPLKISDHPIGVALVEELPVSKMKARLVRSDGEVLPVAINAVPIYDAARRLGGAMACFRSGVLEEEADEPEEVKRLSFREIHDELLAMMFRWESIHVVQRYMCESLVHALGLGLAWIGSVTPDDPRVTTVANSGDRSDFLLKTKVRWDDSDFGNGPSGLAIRTGEVQVVDMIATDPRMDPWRKQALSFGLHSTVSLPIMLGDQRYGVLSCLAVEERFFTPDRVESLRELSVLLSFCWAALTQRTAYEEKSFECDIMTSRLQGILSGVPHAIAVFDALAPFRCITSNPGFRALLDEPYRRDGGIDHFLSDFIMSCLHRSLYDDIQLVLESGEPMERLDDSFVSWDGTGSAWNWRLQPIHRDGPIVEILYLAWPSTAPAGGAEAPQEVAEVGTFTPLTLTLGEFTLEEKPLPAPATEPAPASGSDGMRIGEVFDVVHQGVICLEMPELPARARKDRKLQHVYTASHITVCNDAALRFLDLQEGDAPLGRAAEDVLPTSEEFGDAMIEALSGKAGEATLHSTQEVKNGGFRILNTRLFPERTGDVLRLWITITEMM